MASPTPADYSFGQRNAAERYEAGIKNRSGVVDKARELAKITLPAMFPDEGWRPGDPLPPPNQSVNARCVVNLASKIMFTALPPGKPILKYNIIEHKLKGQLTADPELYAATVLGLAARERANRQRLEGTGVRSAYVQAASQLIISGNVLWKHMDIDNPSIARCDSYVVKRNAVGLQRWVVEKTVQEFEDLDPFVGSFVRNVQLANGTLPKEGPKYDDAIVIYCCCKLHFTSKTKRVWLYWEEFEGEMIPDTDVMTEFDSPPLFAAWLIPAYGHSWGISYCQQYEGDMYIVENNEGALNDGAEAAALSWIFVKPGGTTSKRTIDKAENLRTMYGDANDLTVFRFDKNNDFAWVNSRSETAGKRLYAAFLMLSSIQRAGDRVTAEEWRLMASELDMAMGGLYSELAQSWGRHVIMRFLALQEEEDKDMLKLPPGLVRIGVVTGIDALGLSDEEQNLENALGVLSKFLGPEALMQFLNGVDIIKRVFAGNSVVPDGLVKDQQQVDGEMQQAQQQGMRADLLKGMAPAIAKEGAKAIAPAAVAQYQQANQQPQ